MSAKRLAWLAAAVVSGAAALAWELLWLRRVGELVGSTRSALAVVLAVLFGGLALGTWWGTALVRRVGGARALRWCELVIAVAGLALGAALGGIEAAYDAWAPPGGTSLATVARALAATVAIGPAALALGATWPAFCAAFGARGEGDRGSLGALYGANTLGGVLGVGVATFVLLPMFGLVGAGLVAAAGNLSVAAFALTRRRSKEVVAQGGEPGSARSTVDALERRSVADAPRGAEGQRSARTDGGGDATHGVSERARDERLPSEPWRPTLLAAAAASGFAAIGLEVVWSRALAPHLGGTVYSFGAVLATYLLALAVGAWLDAVLARRGVDARRAASALAFGAGLAAAGSAFVLGRLADVHTAPAVTTLGEVGLALAVLFVPVVGFGAFLPALARAGGVGERGVARTWAANTLGGVLGSPVAAFVALPGLGLASALGAFAAVAWGLGVVLWPDATKRGALALGAAAVAWVAWRFGGDPRVWAEHERDVLLAYVEGRAASVAVVETEERGRVLKVDGNYRLGSSRTGFAQRRQGLVPLLLVPGPESALFLGVATGSSVGAAAGWPLARTTGVELVPGVLDQLQLFASVNDGLARRPDGVRLLEADARHFVRTTDERFDVVVGDLFVPWRAGEGAMYTREHLTAVRDVLAEGGVFVQWLPLYQLPLSELRTVLATFLDVFADVQLLWLYFQAEQPAIGVVATNGPWSFPADVAERTEARAARLQRDGLADPDETFASWICAREGVEELAQGAPLETNLRPRVEFAAPRVRATSRLAIAAENLEALVELARARSLEPVVPAGGTKRAAELRSALLDFLDVRRRWLADGDGAAAVERYARLVALGPEWGFLDYEADRFRRECAERGAPEFGDALDDLVERLRLQGHWRDD